MKNSTAIRTLLLIMLAVGLMALLCACGSPEDPEATTPAATTAAAPTPPTPSVGLAFTSNDDGTCYVSGIGTCTDTAVVIPETSPSGDRVTGIGEEAFYECAALSSVMVPASLESIGDWAFDACYALTAITFAEGSRLTSIGEGAFHGCRALHAIEIPQGVTCISEDTFDGCFTLVSVTFAEGSRLTSIGEAFDTCRMLSTIVLPAMLEEIGDGAFNNCTALSEVVIPASVTSIGREAFRDCQALSEVVIPASVTSIGWDAFRDCQALSSITVDSENQAYRSIDGSLYTKDGKTLFRYAIGKTATRFEIPATVEAIGAGAFAECTALSEVVIPASVTSIGEKAFSECRALSKIWIPASVTSIDEKAFADCAVLSEITIPATVESVGRYAFKGSNALTVYCEAESQPSGWDSLSVRDRGYYCTVVWDCQNNDIASDGYLYTFIGGIRYALKDDDATVTYQPKNIETADIPVSVTYKGTSYAVTAIGERAFHGCAALSSVTVPASMEIIDQDAFLGCKALTEITVPSSVIYVGSYAFAGCDALTIYCEAASQPSEWGKDWSDGCTVIWSQGN